MTIDYDRKLHDWHSAWNSRDAQNICELYAENIVFISPFVAKLGMSDRGVLTDIQALYKYVQATLSRVTNLKYEVVANCVGAQGQTIVYRNQSSHIVAETLEYNDEGLIRLANVAFSTAPIKRKNYGSR